MALPSSTLATISGGFNHNIAYRGITFHVQTEVASSDGGRVDTHVFVGGRIIATRRRSFRESSRASEVLRGMKDQHRDVLRDLISDRLTIPRDLMSRAAASPPRAKPVAPRPAAARPATVTSMPAQPKSTASESIVRARRERPPSSLTRAASSRPPRRRDVTDPSRRARAALMRLNALLADDREEYPLRSLGVAMAVVLGTNVERYVSANALRMLKMQQDRLIQLIARKSSPDDALRSDCAALGALLQEELHGSRAHAS